MKLLDFQMEIERINRNAHYGCTNHGCKIMPKTGMGTNSSCQCTPHTFSEHLLWLAAELDKGGKYAQWEKEGK